MSRDIKFLVTEDFNLSFNFISLTGLLRNVKFNVRLKPSVIKILMSRDTKSSIKGFCLQILTEPETLAASLLYIAVVS